MRDPLHHSHLGEKKEGERGEKEGERGEGKEGDREGGEGRERDRETKKDGCVRVIKKGGRRMEKGKDEEGRRRTKRKSSKLWVHLKQHSLRLIIREELSLPPLMEQPSLSSGK